MRKKNTPELPCNVLSKVLFIKAFQNWIVGMFFITALLSFNTQSVHASIFRQSLIDSAANIALMDYKDDMQNAEMPQANAVYFMALVVHQNPAAKYGTDNLVYKRLLAQLRSLISPGKEPNAISGIGGWTHCQVALAFTLAKNTPVVWSELTADEIAKIDLIMKALAIAGHYGYDDQNNYLIDLHLLNDHGKNNNPNYQVGPIGVMIAASVYFGATELNNIFKSFSYDSYISQFTSYNFTNLLSCWQSQAWGPILENTNTTDGLGGKGNGVKNDFTFKGIGTNDPFMLYKKVNDWMYGTAKLKDWNKSSVVFDAITIVNNGVTQSAYTLGTGSTSPYLGQPGMAFEFHACRGGGNDLRSSIEYVAEAWNSDVSIRSFLQELGYWSAAHIDSVADIETKMFVGSEDFLYKASKGYHCWNKTGYDYLDSQLSSDVKYTGKGLRYTKEIWQKTQASKVKTSLTAWQSFDISPVNGTFTAEFDVVPNKNNINAIIGLQNGVAADSADQACAIRFYNNGKIEARNGNAYQTSSISYKIGKRYHIRMVVNVINHTYTIYVKPAGESEVILGSDFAFRKEQNSALQLTGWSLAHLAGSAGSLRVTNMQFSNVSNNLWQSYIVSTQADVFTAEFDAVPDANTINEVIGIQNGDATAYTDQACAIRFYDGKIDARNGSEYTTSTLTYTAGEKYHFKLVINIPKHTYSIYVTPPGGTQVILGTDYAFRTEQSSVLQLTGWSRVSPGTTTVSGMKFSTMITPEEPKEEPKEDPKEDPIEDPIMSSADRENERGISIYPNPIPANSPLIIDLGNYEGMAKVKITDLKGSKVFNGIILDKKITVNLIEPGIYMIYVKTKTEAFTRKIIVQ